MVQSSPHPLKVSGSLIEVYGVELSQRMRGEIDIQAETLCSPFQVLIHRLSRSVALFVNATGKDIRLSGYLS